MGARRTKEVKEVKEQFSFIIDYDEHPDIGGYQGIFYGGTNEFGGHTHEGVGLIGCKIIKVKMNELNQLVFTVEK